jgi:hypothetical protein
MCLAGKADVRGEAEFLGYALFFGRAGGAVFQTGKHKQAAGGTPGLTPADMGLEDTTTEHGLENSLRFGGFRLNAVRQNLQARRYLGLNQRLDQSYRKASTILLVWLSGVNQQGQSSPGTRVFESFFWSGRLCEAPVWRLFYKF